jgi:hypothetical protein
MGLPMRRNCTMFIALPTGNIKRFFMVFQNIFSLIGATAKAGAIRRNRIGSPLLVERRKSNRIDSEVIAGEGSAQG